MLLNIPAFAKSFLIDFIEGAVASLLALNIALPTTREEWVFLGGAVAIGFVHALVSAARRAAPGFIAWVREKLS